jgi:hypothetical protein
MIFYRRSHCEIQVPFASKKSGRKAHKKTSQKVISPITLKIANTLKYKQKVVRYPEDSAGFGVPKITGASRTPATIMEKPFRFLSLPVQS